MRISTNIPALYASANIHGVNKTIDTAMRRLSSGHRINSVSDDPAGMAISNKLRSQLRGLEVSDRNAMDAVSIIQTSEGALQEVHNMLHRMKELSVQAANGTYEPGDRQKMQEEMDSLLEEINAIAAKTEFNGIRLLNGEAARLTAPADSGNIRTAFVSENVPVGKLSYTIAAGDVGMSATINTASTGNLTLPFEGKLEINGESVEFSLLDSQNTRLEKFRELCDRNNLEIAFKTGESWSDFATGAEIMIYTKDAGSHETISIDGDNAVLAALGLSTQTVKGTDAKVTGATLNGENMTAVTEGNHVTFMGTGGKKIEIDIRLADGPDGALKWYMKDGATNASVYQADTAAHNNTVDILDFGTLIFQVGPDKDMELNVQIPEVSVKSLGLTNLNIRTIADAIKANDHIEKAISTLSSVRSKLGAYQNRLEYMSKSLNVSSENTSMALSRIYDTDMAQEMTTLTQNNVIAQAGMAILAQANQRPQQLLQLLN